MILKYSLTVKLRKENSKAEVVITREIFIGITSRDSIMSQRLQTRTVLQAKLRHTLYYRIQMQPNVENVHRTGATLKDDGSPSPVLAKCFCMYFSELRVIKKNTGDLYDGMRVSEAI